MNKYRRLLVDNKSIPYSEIFQETLYKYYKTENYGRKCLIELSKETDISFNSLTTYIYNYVEKEFGMDRAKFDKFKKEQREKNKDTFIGVENFILKKYDIETKFLYRNEEEKELLLQEIYKVSSKNKFSLDSTREMAEKLKISQTRYLKLIREYMLDYLHVECNEIPDFETLNKRKGDNIRLNNQKLRNLYSQIINFDLNDDMSKLANVIEYSGYNVTAIKENYGLYKAFYSEEEQEKFEENYSKYLEYRKEQIKIKRKELNLEKEKARLKEAYEIATNIITSYLEANNITFKDFLIKNNISEDEFKQYVDTVKYHNKELYNNYLNMKKKKEKEYNEELNNKIKEIGNRLVSGYEENGVWREFDIIDYFSITKMPVPFLTRIAERVLSDYQFELLKKLKKKHFTSDEYNSREEKAILGEKRIVGAELDKNGRYIEGSGRVITDQEKEKLLNYLREKEIAVNNMTYNAALKRYLAGFLSFDNKNMLKLTNK